MAGYVTADLSAQILCLYPKTNASKSDVPAFLSAQNTQKQIFCFYSKVSTGLFMSLHLLPAFFKMSSPYSALARLYTN
jgi:hypothetical protein